MKHDVIDPHHLFPGLYWGGVSSLTRVLNPTIDKYSPGYDRVHFNAEKSVGCYVKSL